MFNINSIKSAYNQINWKEVQHIVTEGLKIFIALVITFSIYAVEGTISTYKWMQPRLAMLLQHPYQTVAKGPAVLYNESVEALMIGTPTVGEKAIIKVGTFIYNVIRIIEEFNYTQFKSDLKGVLNM
jgi:hypothetical protein